MKKRKTSTESFYFRVWSVAIHLPQAPEDITKEKTGKTPPQLMKQGNCLMPHNPVSSVAVRKGPLAEAGEAC